MERQTERGKEGGIALNLNLGDATELYLLIKTQRIYYKTKL